MTEARLLIIDDHPVVREGMAPLIDQYDGLQVAGQAENSAEGLRLLRENTYDLAVVDLALEGIGGLDLTKKITAEFKSLPVLVLSMQDESLYAERALGAGARGYVMKEESIPQIVEAIRTVLRGDIYLSEAMTRWALRTLSGDEADAAGSPAHRLSDRELEVFHLLGEGNGTREIAEQLHLSVKTIESHRAGIKKKLNLKNATDLLQRAALWVHQTRRAPDGD